MVYETIPRVIVIITLAFVACWLGRCHALGRGLTMAPVSGRTGVETLFLADVVDCSEVLALLIWLTKARRATAIMRHDVFEQNRKSAHIAVQHFLAISVTTLYG